MSELKWARFHNRISKYATGASNISSYQQLCWYHLLSEWPLVKRQLLTRDHQSSSPTSPLLYSSNQSLLCRVGIPLHPVRFKTLNLLHHFMTSLNPSTVILLCSICSSSSSCKLERAGVVSSLMCVLSSSSIRRGDGMKVSLSSKLTSWVILSSRKATAKSLLDRLMFDRSKTVHLLPTLVINLLIGPCTPVPVRLELPNSDTFSNPLNFSKYGTMVFNVADVMSRVPIFNVLNFFLRSGEMDDISLKNFPKVFNLRNCRPEIESLWRVIGVDMEDKDGVAFREEAGEAVF